MALHAAKKRKASKAGRVTKLEAAIKPTANNHANIAAASVVSDTAQVVFDIPELLEHILMQVPPKSLLASALRVSKQWKAAIESSINIQEKLCFKSRATVALPRGFDAEVSPDTQCIRYTQPVRLNELLPTTYAYAMHFDSRQHQCDPESMDCKIKELYVTTRRFSRYYQFASDLPSKADVDLSRTGLPIDQCRSMLSHDKAASWNSMFLTVPPVSVMRLTAIVELKGLSQAGTHDETILVAFHAQDRSGIKAGLYQTLMHEVWVDILEELEPWAGDDLKFEGCALLVCPAR